LSSSNEAAVSSNTRLSSVTCCSDSAARRSSSLACLKAANRSCWHSARSLGSELAPSMTSTVLATSAHFEQRGSRENEIFFRRCDDNAFVDVPSSDRDRRVT
jgi:hypothetical protein